MDLIPHDELKPTSGINYAPMIDFLFLMLALFATLAISKASLHDTEIHLAELKSPSPADTIQTHKEVQQINISITSTGQFKWLTEFQEYPMSHIEEIQKEISRQYQIGALAQDKSQTEILLHIDKDAPWDPIARTIFAIRELGFSVHPVYTNASGS